MRAVVFVVIAFTLFFLIDLYAYQAVRVVFSTGKEVTRRIAMFSYWGVSGFMLVYFVFGFLLRHTIPSTINSVMFSVFLVLLVSKLIVVSFMLIDDTGRLVRLIGRMFTTPDTAEESITKGITRARFLSQTAAVVALAPLLTGLYGVFKNAYNYKIHRVTVKLPNLPEAFNGLKIVQISDIHSGSFAMKSPVEQGIEMINAEEPDLVFFTGDIVNQQYSELEDYLDVFGKIKAREGIFSIFGNHDYGWYRDYQGEKAQTNRRKLIEMQRGMGWDLLLNEHRILRRGEDKLAIIGVENYGTSDYFPKEGDLDKAREGMEEVPVKLLLSHDPSHWDHTVRPEHKDIDITFSGHTHGGQFGVELPGFKWSPAQYAYKQWAGLYQEAGQYLYVNRGFGFLAFHGRIGILPEITVMELVKG